MQTGKPRLGEGGGRCSVHSGLTVESCLDPSSPISPSCPGCGSPRPPLSSPLASHRHWGGGSLYPKRGTEHFQIQAPAKALEGGCSWQTLASDIKHPVSCALIQHIQLLKTNPSSPCWVLGCNSERRHLGGGAWGEGGASLSPPQTAPPTSEGRRHLVLASPHLPPRPPSPHPRPLPLTAPPALSPTWRPCLWVSPHHLHPAAAVILLTGKWVRWKPSRGSCGFLKGSPAPLPALLSALTASGLPASSAPGRAPGGPPLLPSPCPSNLGELPPVTRSWGGLSFEEWPWASVEVRHTIAALCTDSPLSEMLGHFLCYSLSGLPLAAHCASQHTSSRARLWCPLPTACPGPVLTGLHLGERDPHRE